MNLICGINPVLEALAASNRHFDRLLIVKGLRSRRLSEAIRRASQLGVPLRFEMRETLDRMAGGVAHQGIIAVVSAKPGCGEPVNASHATTCICDKQSSGALHGNPQGPRQLAITRPGSSPTSKEHSRRGELLDSLVAVVGSAVAGLDLDLQGGREIVWVEKLVVLPGQRIARNV